MCQVKKGMPKNRSPCKSEEENFPFARGKRHCPAPDRGRKGSDRRLKRNKQHGLLGRKERGGKEDRACY